MARSRARRAAAFANALANNKDGFTTLLAVVAPNLPCKPDTVLFNKVTIKGAKQAVQMFGPAQAAVARAVVDSVADGVIDKGKADDLCILVGVFIHWEAADDTKIFDYNYEATMESIARALGKQADHRRCSPAPRRPSTRSARSNGRGLALNRPGERQHAASAGRCRFIPSHP